ncbi:MULTISPECIES: spore germination protein [unclassified Paenibacillus]|uniref:spore germination protein n=1 Tax=unclassified Paenibacillus TaxID=185978 RepID=UPI0036321278
MLRNKGTWNDDQIPNPNQSKSEDTLIHNDITFNEQALREIFHLCSDIIFRPIQIHGQTKVMLIYLDGFIDNAIMDEVILKPLMFHGMPQGLEQIGNLEGLIRGEAIAVSQTKLVHQICEMVQAILKGQVAILVDGHGSALLAELKGFEKRGVEEPTSEVSIRGPRDGFTETLRINTSLVRRRIRSARLKLEPLVIGEMSQTDVVILYIEGIAQSTIVEEVRRRLSSIQIDAEIGAGFLEEFIEDLPFSPFPQIQNTERPDVVVSSLLEGKVAIMEDGSPYVLIVPMTFWSAMQSAEDYYERFLYATAVRWIRYTLLIMSLLLPAAYVAIVSYHPQLMPTNLLLSIAAAREPSPFPAVVEALLMEFTFEALREAGIRLPRAAGSAVSIVGALVVGQAAVQAGIVSAPMVIVIATTGIASFAIPRYNFGTAFRLLRFPMLLLGGMLGFFGIGIGSLAILIHLVNLQSFGVPYLTPVAPQFLNGLKDTLIRAPRWAMQFRSVSITGKESERISQGRKPGPQQGDNQP